MGILTLLLNNKLTTFLVLIAAVAVSSAAWNWYHPKVTTVTKTEYQTVTQEKVVEKIKRVTIPGPTKIVTIEKKTIGDKLDLWPMDEGSQVIANADIPASGSGTSVVTVIDMNTGESKIIAKEKPLPLFGFPSNIEAGIRYGISTTGPQEGNMFARWQFLRVGKAYVAGYGEVSTNPQAKVMLEASFKF